MTTDKNKAFEWARQLLVSALKVANPELSDKEAESVIANTGNYIQLKRLEEGK